MTELMKTNDKIDAVESALVQGDLSKLNTQERVRYYFQVCHSLGLNPVTKPFEYVSFQSKLTLYAGKNCAEQLRSIKGISLQITEAKQIGDIYIVIVAAKDKDGRSDVATGAVNIKGLQGDALANAFMKAETKAKRRATFSICGLGMLDETELETIPGAQKLTEEEVQKRAEIKNETVQKMLEGVIQASGKTVDIEGALDLCEKITGKAIDQFNGQDFRAISTKIQAVKSGKLEWETLLDLAEIPFGQPISNE